MNKKCTECGKEKPISEFYKQKNGKYGVKGNCKECHSLWHKRYHIENRDRENAVNERWRQNNLERRKEMTRIYNNSSNGIYQKLKSRSKRKNRVCTITKDSFVKWHKSVGRVCEYCGYTHDELVKFDVRYSKRAKRLTIDRKDNDKGYIDGNLVIACGYCNEIKSNFFSYEDMKQIGKIIHDRIAIIIKEREEKV